MDTSHLRVLAQGAHRKGMNLPSPCINRVWAWLDPHSEAAPSIPGVHPEPHSHRALGSPTRMLWSWVWVSPCPDTPPHPDPACGEAAAPRPPHPPRCSRLTLLLITLTLPAGSRRRCLISAEVKGTLGYGRTRGGSPVCR